MINYLRDVTSWEDRTPPPLDLSKDLGGIQGIVARSSKWRLGESFIPDSDLKKMVVKNSILSPPNYDHREELRILRHLPARSTINRAPHSIVRLVWDPALRNREGCYEFVEKDADPPLPRVQFGITPVGLPFELAVFKTPADFQNATDSLLDGLQWLHTTALVIHRDIRPANVIVNRSTQNAVIIDFDCALRLPSVSVGGGSLPDTGNAHLTYGGGLIAAFTVVLSGVLSGVHLPVLSSVLEKRTGKRTVNFECDKWI